MTFPSRLLPAPDSALRLFSGAALLILGGCASASLRDAPTRPDQPWTPDTNQQGMIVPHAMAGKALRHPMLHMPPGYALPSDPTLPQHRQGPSLTPDHAYTLAELIDIAQSTNPQTRMAWNTARDAALATGMTRAIYLPQLTAAVVGGYNHTKTHRSGNDLSSLNSFSANNDGEIQTLALKWLLFDFGRRSALLQAAQENSLASNILFTGVHQKVIYDVASAYYLQVAARAHIDLARQALANTRLIEHAAQARLQHDQGTVIDTAQAAQAVAQAELRLVQARGATENRSLALMTAIGITPTTHISLKEDPQRPLTLDDIHLSEQMVHDAVARRPDVLAAYAAERAAQSQVAAARAGFFPKIFVTGNVTYGTGNLGLSGLPGIGDNSSPSLNIGSNNFNGIILGGITMPVFDGGLRQAQLKSAKNRADSAIAKRQHAQDTSVHDIVAAENSLHTAIAAHTAAEKLEKTARTAFDAALTAYRTGEGSITRMLELQNALFDATLAQSDSYYAALIAAASLAFATGSLGDISAVEHPVADYLSTP